jgi:hypothetical protein
MSHKRLAKHLARDIARFGRRFHEVDASFESVSESPLPASSGVHLRFHDQIVRAEFARDLFRFRGGLSHPTARRGSAKFLQQLFRLIFVNVHAVSRASDVLQLARERQGSNGFFRFSRAAICLRWSRPAA